MYNFYGNSDFKIGDRIRIPDGCGLDSGKHGRVINHFPWREEVGAYKAPEQHFVPVMLDNNTKHYFSRKMLLHESKEYDVSMSNICVIYSPKKKTEV